MSDSITLSKKYGVNPTIPVCFICGKEKNEVALLGRLPHDAEAPKNAIIDYEPCDDCKEKLKTHTLLMEATFSAKDSKTFPIGTTVNGKEQKAYPTGKCCMFPADLFKNSKAGIVLCEPGVIDIIKQKIDDAVKECKNENKTKSESE